MDYLIDSSFHLINRLFFLSFEIVHTKQVEIKHCNDMIDGKKIDEPVKHTTILILHNCLLTRLS